MEVSALEEKIERNKVLRLIGKVILMILSLGVLLVGSLIVSGEIGAATYKIWGVPAQFHMVWGKDLINYIEVSGGEQFLVPVILSRGLGTLAIFLGLWYLVHRLRWSWKLIFEPWLLIAGGYQVPLTLFVLCDLIWGSNLGMGLCLLGIAGLPIFVFLCCHYSERVKNWL